MLTLAGSVCKRLSVNLELAFGVAHGYNYNALVLLVDTINGCVVLYKKLPIAHIGISACFPLRTPVRKCV